MKTLLRRLSESAPYGKIFKVSNGLALLHFSRGIDHEEFDCEHLGIIGRCSVHDDPELQIIN